MFKKKLQLACWRLGRTGLSMGKRKTAIYKIIIDAGGNRYEFYCDVSGALVCTTRKTYTAETPEQELLLAWEKEGKKHFNHCRKCSKWVIDAMFNPEVAECVECAPFEAEAKFCKTCGAKVEVPGRKCPSCGNTLNYVGRTD